MTAQHTCVSIYSGCQAAERALSRLQISGIGEQQISVVSSGYLQEEAAVGFYTVGDCVSYYGLQNPFWGHLCRDFPAVAFFWISGFGPLVAAGSIVTLIVNKLDDVDISGGLDILGTALFRLGVPRKNITEYEQAIRAEKILLIIHGQHNEVEMACSVMHSQTQQVIVHFAGNDKYDNDAGGH